MITKLKQLWIQAFGDSPESVDAFFATGYAPVRSAVIYRDDRPVSALYWLDYRWGEEKLAYIYAVATEEQFRGQGLGRQLMEQAHRQLREQGYAGAVLVPAEEYLVHWYEKQGYQVFFRAKRQEITASTAIPVTRITAEQYAVMRREKKPEAPQPEKELYNYFATYGSFYMAENCLFAVAVQGNTAYFQEFLGDPRDLPYAVAALGARTGIVRLPDREVPFAMIYRFTDGPLPDYFSFALD